MPEVMAPVATRPIFFQFCIQLSIARTPIDKTRFTVKGNRWDVMSARGLIKAS
jgi:hypothetical protein